MTNEHVFVCVLRNKSRYAEQEYLAAATEKRITVLAEVSSRTLINRACRGRVTACCL